MSSELRAFLTSMDGLTIVVLPILGAFAHHLWSRFRGRMAELRWTVTYTPLAFASEDAGWGRVEIVYNGQPTGTLHMANIRLQNASARDLQSLVIVLTANPGTVALRGRGNLLHGAAEFPFTDDFSSNLHRLAAGALSALETQAILPRMEFIIPVLNRGSIAVISVLLNRGDSTTAPSIALDCDHVGVRVRHHAFAVTVWGVRQGQAQLAGILASVAITTSAVLLDLPTWIVALVGCISGLFAIFFGAALLKLGQTLAALVD